MIFPNGMEALGGACACRLLRLASDSTAFILQNAENGSERLLLGDVRRIGPEALPVLTAEEFAALSCLPGDMLETLPDDMAVLCRMRIPHKKPQEAGFDLARLVLINTRNGKALEAERPGAPLIPLVSR